MMISLAAVICTYLYASSRKKYLVNTLYSEAFHWPKTIHRALLVISSLYMSQKAA